MTLNEKMAFVDRHYPDMSIRKQCDLLGVNRSTYYHKPTGESESDRVLMNLIDEEYTRHPFYGSRRMAIWLKGLGYEVNRKRTQRLMRAMGLVAIYPKPNLSKNDKLHKRYPYLLREVPITKPNQVWSTDITYIRLANGFCYCVAIIDWYSRYVMAWRLSNTLDTMFCLEALKEALLKGKPEIFNSDQGVQFTSIEFTSVLEKSGIQISMDGKGRAIDNIFIERLWRSLKYENVYLKNYDSQREAREGIKEYIEFYNKERKHQALGYKCPYEVYI